MLGRVRVTSRRQRLARKAVHIGRVPAMSRQRPGHLPIRVPNWRRAPLVGGGAVSKASLISAQREGAHPEGVSACAGRDGVKMVTLLAIGARGVGSGGGGI